MNTLLKQHLSRSRLRMQHQADKSRSERSFEVGDLVFLKLQPYVQTSLASRANQKLAFKYFGLFKIIAKIGKVAYKLLLPESSSVHPVFHVSQLKQALSDEAEVIPVIPSDVDLPRIPEKVLQRRLITKGLQQVQQVLVKWSNWQLEMTTLENVVALQQFYPFAPAWGQAASYQGGNVSNAQAQQEEVRRSKRPRKENPRVSGLEWSI